MVLAEDLQLLARPIERGLGRREPLQRVPLRGAALGEVDTLRDGSGDHLRDPGEVSLGAALEPPRSALPPLRQSR